MAELFNMLFIVFSATLLLNVVCFPLNDDHVVQRKSLNAFSNVLQSHENILYRRNIRHLQDDEDNDAKRARITFKCPRTFGSFAYPKDCSRHYLCILKKANLMRCDKGELFDEKKGECLNKDKVDCGSRRNPYVISSICEKPNGLFVKRGSYCRSYLNCKNGAAVEKLCPNGELFDEKSGKCDWKEIVECYDRDILCPASDGSFVVKGTKCKSYVVCKTGKANVLICPEDRLFDSEHGYCDWSELVQCDGKETTVSGKTTTATSFWGTSNVYNVTLTPSREPSTTASSAKITKVTQISTISTSEQITKSSELITPATDQISTSITTLFPKISTVPERVTTPTTPRSISSTDSMKVTTPIKTSYPEISTISRPISSTISERVTTVIETSHPKISTNRRPISSTVPGSVTTPIKTSYPEISTTPRPISSIVSERITTPIKTSYPKISTTPRPISSTVPEQVTTPIKTPHPEISTTPHPISSIVSERVTTPIETPHPKMSTTPRSISSTVPEQVTTTIKTSYPKMSTTSLLISSTIPEQITTPITTSYSKITTTPQETKTVFRTTMEDITFSESSASGNLTTSQASSKITSFPGTGTTMSNLITNSVPATSAEITTTQTQSNTSPSPAQYSTPRGCQLDDESCLPDETLCPGEFGEFPHPDTPFYFVHCDHWRPYIKKCPAGLHFDAKLKVCDWPK